jgi:hypothetical protein
MKMNYWLSRMNGSIWMDMNAVLADNRHEVDCMFIFGIHDILIDYERGKEPVIQIYNNKDGSKRNYPNTKDEDVTLHYPNCVNIIMNYIPEWDEVENYDEYERCNRRNY